MKFIFSKKTGEVKMRTDDNVKNDYDKTLFDEIVLLPTQTEIDNINEGQILSILNGKLSFKIPVWTQEMINRKTIKDALASATTIDQIKTALQILIK